MPAMNVGEYLVRSAIPEPLRGRLRSADPDAIEDFLKEVSQEMHPDDYRVMLQKIFETGAELAFYEGNSFSLNDFKTPSRSKKIRDGIQRDIKTTLHGPGTMPEKEEKIKAIVWDRIDSADKEMLDEATELGSGLAWQIKSKVRGKPADMRSVLWGDGLMQGNKGEIIPIPLLHGYAEGVTPSEYFANSYGTRDGAISVKKSTADAGYLGKKIGQAAHRQVITEQDCGISYGSLEDGGDIENIGSILAADVGQYKAGTVINEKVRNTLAGTQVQLRSPYVCQAEGLCAKCAGIRETGKLHEIGDNIGVTAGQDVKEKAVQSALSCLQEGTLVRMADLSVKPIEQVKVGDFVVGADINGNTFPSKVTRVYDQGMHPVVHYRFRKGQGDEYYDLFSTECHKILANTSKSRCKEDTLNKVMRVLPVGYSCSRFYAIPQQGSYDIQEPIEEGLAVLLGLMYGDGCRGKEPLMSCADASLISDVQPLLNSVGMHAVKRGRSYDWALTLINKNGKVSTNSATGRFTPEVESRNPLKAVLVNHGIYGKYCHEKTVSDDIKYRWGLESVRKFIAGYFASDGSVYTNKEGLTYIGFGCTSKELTEGIKYLLEVRLGMHTSAVHRSKVKGGRDAYGFILSRITEVRNFAGQIGPYVPGVKRDRMAAMLSSADYDRHVPFFRVRRYNADPVGIRHCYDIEVEHKDSLFVLENGLIVSNSKHSSGRVDSKAKQFISGFKLLEQLMDVPESFRDAATIASLDGVVSAPQEAPQGGQYINVGDTQHYIPRGMTINIKPGTFVEAGEVITDGIPNPAELIKYRGIGDARRQFVEGMKVSGANRRNLEVLARGFVDYVNIEDPEAFDELSPGDTVRYSDIVKRYKPRKSAAELTPTAAKGMYLEQEAGHFSIGTRVTDRVAKQINKLGIPKIYASPEDPPFKPVMVPSVRGLMHAEDWRERMGGYYLKDSLLDAAMRGLSSPKHGTSYYGPFMEGADFGKELKATGRY